MTNQIEREQTLKSIESLDERVRAIEYERKVNPDYELPDDYYSCKRLADSLRMELGEDE